MTDAEERDTLPPSDESLDILRQAELLEKRSAELLETALGLRAAAESIRRRYEYSCEYRCSCGMCPEGRYECESEER